jgi:flagellar hook protein FlgE
MGILSSMNTGITGLSAQGESLNINADNIANANTTGFKTSRGEFSDIIARSLKGILGGNQIGRGTKLTNVTPILSQGDLVQTDRSTDLAIQGDGFYVLRGEEGQSFSRNGSFRFNAKGQLVSQDGYRVMGYAADEEGKITHSMEPIELGRTIIDAKGTEKVKMNMNLDARDPIQEFDPERPDETSSYATDLTIYDSAGNPHLATLYFNKVEDSTWEYHVMVKGEEIPDGEPGELYKEGGGRLTFDNSGKLLSQEMTDNEYTFNQGALPGQVIEFSFGDDIESGGTGVLGATQYGADSDVFKHNQDGYTVGTLTSLSFDDDGLLSAAYSNGQVLDVAQVALAKFENSEGLFKLGNNRFRESRKSGQPLIGKPNTAGRGRVFAKTLEQSTTDIASEFVDIIKTQRAFQANARTVTTADELLQEILNWKR